MKRPEKGIMICAWGIDTEIDEWAVILREDTVIQYIYFVFRSWYSYKSYHKLLHKNKFD